VFSLVPTSKTSLFKEITIVFVDGVPDSIALTDTLSQKTKIQFGNVNLNPALDDTAFDFVVPADVDVINNVR
ncbi:MAG: outer-membrane lipoprotein carrier protein LolA, partial [Porticoccaceae bacterium]|nr:outer-membrane lipoprotein carrier protein LolA [Porticoccaceae bacterium]